MTATLYVRLPSGFVRVAHVAAPPGWEHDGTLLSIRESRSTGDDTPTLEWLTALTEVLQELCNREAGADGQRVRLCP